MTNSAKRQILHTHNRILALALAGLLSACGSSGSESSSAEVTPANQAPTVDAGTDQTVTELSAVTLSGSATDSDGSISSYTWSQTSGTNVTLTDDNTSNTSFTAPDLSEDETLTFVLTATDDDGASQSDSVNVYVEAQPLEENLAPIADAGNDQSVNSGDTVTLSAALSSDANEDVLSYAWRIAAAPEDSTASLSENNTVEVRFTADLAGDYVIELIVNDGILESDADTVTISASVGPVDITNAIFTRQSGSCADYVGSYYANVEDIQRAMDFAGNVVISADDDTCTFSVNAIPNHDFNDASAAFATNASEQNGQYQVATNPTVAAQVTQLDLGVVNAILLNGVALDMLAAACYNVGNEPLGQERIGCGPEQRDNPWRYDPMSPLNGFGTDIHNAHVQPDGTYHYHGNPNAMFDMDCDVVTQESPVIGFAADGFPVFGSCINDKGTVRKATSSYQLKDNGGPRQDVAGYITPEGGVGLIASDNYDGQFRGDYQYVEGSGDLDECNGMVINGQYGYFITDSYPWVMGCFKGSIDASMQKQGAALETKLHSHGYGHAHSH